MYTPVNPSFFYIKVVFKGVNIIQACFRDAFLNVQIYFLRILIRPQHFQNNNKQFQGILKSDRFTQCANKI